MRIQQNDRLTISQETVTIYSSKLLSVSYDLSQQVNQRNIRHVGLKSGGGGGGGGGGVTQVQRGHPRYVSSGRRGRFLRPPHVRDFVEEGYFLYPGTKYGGQDPLTIHEIYAALTPSDWASDKHAEDYKILS